jgi:hypothetical protein
VIHKLILTTLSHETDRKRAGPKTGWKLFRHEMSDRVVPIRNERYTLYYYKRLGFIREILLSKFCSLPRQRNSYLFCIIIILIGVDSLLFDDLLMCLEFSSP